MFDPAEKIHELLQLLRQAEGTLWGDFDPDSFESACLLYEEAIALEEACSFPRAALLQYICFLSHWEMYEDALTYAEKYADAYRGGTLSERVSAALVLGESLLNAQKYEAAEQNLRFAKVREEMLLLTEPDGNCWRLGRICYLLGNTCIEMGSWEKAEAEYKQAGTVFEQLADRAPRAYLLDQWAVWAALAELYRVQQRHEEEEKARMKEVSLLEALVKQNPEKAVRDGGVDFTCIQKLAQACMNLGDFYTERKQYRKAELAFLQNRELLSDIAGGDPLFAHQYLPIVNGNLGAVQEKLDRKKDAHDSYQAAVDACKAWGAAVGLPPETFPLAAHYAEKAAQLEK